MFPSLFLVQNLKLGKTDLLSFYFSFCKLPPSNDSPVMLLNTLSLIQRVEGTPTPMPSMQLIPTSG